MFPPKQVVDNIWIGGYDTAVNATFMQNNNIRLIVNCTKHVASPFAEFIPTYRIPIQDHLAWQETFREHIANALSAMNRALNNHGAVLVHCHAGVSRSSTLVAAYLIRFYGWTPEHAITMIQRKKPETFKPHPIFIEMLRDLYTERGLQKAS